MTRAISRRNQVVRNSALAAAANLAERGATALYNNRKGVMKVAKKIYNYTKSKPKAKARSSPQSGTNNPMGVDREHYSLSLGRKGIKRAKSDGQWLYTQNHAGVTVSASGYQNASVLCAAFTQGQCYTSSGNGYSTYDNFTALAYLNPYLRTTGSPIIAGGIQPANDKFYVKKHRFDVELSNSGNSALIGDLYICVVRKANSSDPVTIWDDGYGDDSFGSGLWVAAAVGTYGGEQLGRLSVVMPGANPGQSTLYKKFHKTLKKVPLDMASGSTKRVTFSTSINKVISDSVKDTLPGTWMPGTSLCLFVVHRGIVGRDATVSAANNVVTYSPSELSYIVTSTSYMGGVKNQANRLNSMFGTSTVPGGATAANIRFMGQSDVIEQTYDDV